MNTIETQTCSRRFEAVLDSRKRKVSGLWRRGKRFYAQLRIDVGGGRTAPRRIALLASDLTTAKAELERKRTERRDGELERPGYRPPFNECADAYLQSAMHQQKKPRTRDSEAQAIARWKTHLGVTRVDKIVLPLIHAYREARLKSGLSARTVNLDVIALRQVLAYAKQCGHLQDLMQFFTARRGGGLEALKQRAPARRPLLSKDQFAALLAAATPQVTKNAKLFKRYLHFLALTGAREQEALHVRRDDVNFERGFVMIGSDSDTKNSRSRAVDFSAELEALLREHVAELPPDTCWLFPSPQRGANDAHARTLRESLKAVRNKAKLPWAGFHDLRHFFASECVMAGIDFMTIAGWLGHSDGGILVGKVYGHIAASHRKEAARRLRFFS